MHNPLVGRGPDITLEELKAGIIAERDGRINPVRLPWPLLNVALGHGLSGGCVTIVTGSPGTAKSYFLLNLLLAADKAGFVWRLLPLEDSAEVWLKKYLAVHVNDWGVASLPEKDSKREWQISGDKKLKAFGVHRSLLEHLHANCIAENPRLPVTVNGVLTTPDAGYRDILEFVRCEAVNNDIIAIDCLSQITFGNDGRDFAQHEIFIRELMGIAAASGSNIILVAHSTKSAAKYGIGGTIDAVQGSALFTRLAHNVITIARHDEVESCVMHRSAPVRHNLTVTVSKCRNGPGNGSFAFDLTPPGPNFIEYGLIVKPPKHLSQPSSRTDTVGEKKKY